MYTHCLFDSPFGKLKLTASPEALVAISFQADSTTYSDSVHKKSKILRMATLQLSEYFTGQRQSFDIPLAPVGTVFQQRVWQALISVPYGSTASYKEIAKKIGNTKAYRSVGGANNKNPLPIVIPCHRIIGSNGCLTGYAGGLAVKKFLLELESAAFIKI